LCTNVVKYTLKLETNIKYSNVEKASTICERFWLSRRRRVERERAASRAAIGDASVAWPSRQGQRYPLIALYVIRVIFANVPTISQRLVVSQ
jgi:hypothetical protein